MPPKTNSHAAEDRVTVRMDIREDVKVEAKIVAARSKTNVQWVYGSLVGLGIELLNAIDTSDLRSDDVAKTLKQLREQRKK